MTRCPWSTSDPLYVRYHDEEWGFPERDSRALFEKLVLDGFQAGLSWLIILRKREAFRRAFDGFDPRKIARWRPPMSKALRERGFTFVGPTICYAFMQAVGMVDDHLVTCFRRRG
ncbi:MAG TPA: DNA-3-methyladenine glycosylase I [Myxococcales bacterium]|nr:DNA-3-methyladenine glycosylase I [Myxococcales bacterium]